MIPLNDPAVHSRPTAAVQTAAGPKPQAPKPKPKAPKPPNPQAPQPPAAAGASAPTAAVQTAAPPRPEVTKAEATEAALVLYSRSRIEDQAAGAAARMQRIQQQLAPSPDDAVILPLQPMVDFRPYQPSRNDPTAPQPPREDGQDPLRSDLLWDKVGNVLLRVPGGLPMCITQAHDSDLDALRSLLRERTEWSVDQLAREVQPKLCEFVIGRTGANEHDNSTYVALSNYMVNQGRAPIHRTSYEEIVK